MRTGWTRGLWITSITLASVPALPREAAPTEWPLERIVANLEERLKESPMEADTLYNLGRAHAFAFVLQRPTVKVWTRSTPPTVADLRKQGLGKAGEKLDPSAPRPELLEHLAEGVRSLRRACAHEENGQYHLTLAWLLEMGAASAARVGTAALFELDASGLAPERRAEIQKWIGGLDSKDDVEVAMARAQILLPENLEPSVAVLSSAIDSLTPKQRASCNDLLQGYWIERSIGEYDKALSLSFEADLTDESRMPNGIEGLHRMVSYEALEGYRRLVLKRGARGQEEEKRLK